MADGPQSVNWLDPSLKESCKGRKKRSFLISTKKKNKTGIRTSKVAWTCQQVSRRTPRWTEIRESSSLHFILLILIQSYENIFFLKNILSEKRISMRSFWVECGGFALVFFRRGRAELCANILPSLWLSSTPWIVLTLPFSPKDKHEGEPSPGPFPVKNRIE